MNRISAADLRTAMYDGAELALFDVREHGQIGEGHILFSAPLSYSRLERDLPRLAPRTSVRMVLCDDTDGVAERAAARAEAMGYSQVSVLDGGVAAWAAAGHTLYRGVNVPSKVFGELVELAEHTPRLSADEVSDLGASGADMVIVDGRPMAEYRKMNIPGAVCCPNGELALRIGRIAPDPSTTVVINCAGRTRSIIGAQTLIDLGIPNKVYALENGTQGWTLAGKTLEHGNEHTLSDPGGDAALMADRARGLGTRHSAGPVSAATLSGWLAGTDRTTFLLDVRTAEERATDTAARAEARDRLGAVHAPGGQLVQATDQWIGVRGARIVLIDSDGIRAPVIAGWLGRLGHTAHVLDGGIDALADVSGTPSAPSPELPTLETVSPGDFDRSTGYRIVDLRSSADYRAGHIDGAVWSIRPRLGDVAGPHGFALISNDPDIAALAAIDLRAAGATGVIQLCGTPDDWRAAGLPVVATPDVPADSDRIDFLFFVHDRHDGNPAASQAYLDWETGLVGQLDAAERGVFRI